MTSLQLFPSVEKVGPVPKEWGTGQYKGEVDVFVPRAPTWQYSGKPTEQLYRLTQLKLSNVRSNDELVPEPHELPIGHIMFNKKFPAEHPYASHMPRTAVFPKFDSSIDPKRGVAARDQRPISDEMPAAAYDVEIKHKTKGFGLRHEVQALPHASEKRAQEWLGEDGFDQLVKTHGGRQEFYPIPPKFVAPNLQTRGADMTISQKSSNVLRNIERDQWQTTYDRSHTGLGPRNPNKLDNLDEKAEFYDTHGIVDDNLYPRSVNTLDPPRPQEGRIAKMLVPRPPPMKTAAAANAPENPDYVRMETLSEREERRLLYGNPYVNLPADADDADDKVTRRWKEVEGFAHADPCLDTLQASKGEPDDVPYHPAGAPPDDTDSKYLNSTKRDQDKNVQEIEAQNRWKVLQAQGPDHDITTLTQKMDLVHDHEKPDTFYGHEGKYNEERAGLYKTSYSPARLAKSMNQPLDSSGPEIMNTMHSHVNSLSLPTKLNHDMKDAFRYSRTLSSSQPNLSGDRRETRELIDQHNRLKQSQKFRLQPTVENARVKVQEGDTVPKESTMGDTYNTERFLQTNQIGKFSRNEPLHVMSAENQNLHNVRKASSSKNGKSVTFADNVTVATSLDSGLLRFSSAPAARGARLPPNTSVSISELPATEQYNTTQYLSTQAQYNPTNDDSDMKLKRTPTVADIPAREEPIMRPKPPSAPLPQRKRPATSEPGTEYRDEFGSLGSNFIPSNLENSMSFDSAYKAQFPQHDIGYKHDVRFDWQPGFGAPRPQTSLLDQQNQFVKSAVRRKFHSMFVESNSDLRQNIVRGKKHTFYGMNGQAMHG